MVEEWESMDFRWNKIIPSDINNPTWFALPSKYDGNPTEKII